ncbi:MAG: hypothetical protein QOH99_1329, partial [Frankiaceae bacterium]|nr:hypothetical protein [Frankiaceae bacterium]
MTAPAEHPDSDGAAGRIVAVAVLAIVCWSLAGLDYAMFHGNWGGPGHPV